MGKRGPKAGSGGRPSKPLIDKIVSGNPGKRKLKVVKFSDEVCAEFPQPPEFLIDATKITGAWPSATDIYKSTVEWLKTTGCLKLIPKDYIEEYALCKARWFECENKNTALGLLTRHPTTGNPILSPYVKSSGDYLKMSDGAWAKIYEVVKANCTSDFRQEGSSNDDIMERLLRGKG